MINVMRRIIILIATVLYATIGWAQTMNIHYKNGQTVQYNMNNIDYVEYTEDNPNNAQVSSGEAVDLGLSVLWASCNVGATSPEQYGDKFAWGETETKSKFKKDNYLYYDSSSESYMDIGSNIGGTDYDVAHVKWGNNWRMPTYEELKELRKECTWQWSNLNGINGWVVIGKNGNSIFFPTGDNTIYLWASTIVDDNLNGHSGSGRGICFSNSTYQYSNSGFSRYFGNYVRPVKSK